MAGETGSIGLARTQGEETKSGYTSYTAREKNWGAMKQKEEWGGRCRQDNSRWGWSYVERKYVQKPERYPEEYGRKPSVGYTPNGGGRELEERRGSILLNFGDYHDWAYGEILRGDYVSYICTESGECSEERSHFKNGPIWRNTSHKRNCWQKVPARSRRTRLPPGGCGFSIIPRNQEANCTGEDPQRAREII